MNKYQHDLLSCSVAAEPLCAIYEVPWVLAKLVFLPGIDYVVFIVIFTIIISIIV